MNKIKIFILITICYISIFNNASSLEIIRDVELENFTKKIVTSLVKNNDIDINEINYYFIKSKEINAFVPICVEATLASIKSLTFSSGSPLT